MKKSATRGCLLFLVVSLYTIIYPPNIFCILFLFQGYPAAQMQTQYMQQGYYPYAYATSAQQAGGMGK